MTGHHGGDKLRHYISLFEGEVFIPNSAVNYKVWQKPKKNSSRI